MGDALHQAAVTEKHPGVVVHDREAGPVELGGQQLLRQGHAHGIGQPLPQGTGGGFDAQMQVPLRVPRRVGAQLPETAELVEGQRVARSGSARSTAAWSRGRSRARSGPGRARRDWPGCAGGSRSRALRRCPPCPWACRGGRIWPVRRRPGTGRGWHWPAVRRSAAGRDVRAVAWHGTPNAPGRVERNARERPQRARIVA